MNWEDEGILIEHRNYGEKNTIIRVLTENHGFCAGLVKGGQTKKYRGTLHPGAQLNVRWSARLSEHLGVFNVDVLKTRSILFMGEKLQLLGFNSLCAMISFFLAEREREKRIYYVTKELLEEIESGSNWLKRYVLWEINLLREIGFGLELSICVVTGSGKNLSHVSPKTGKAVCEEVAEPWKEKLLKLPKFLNASDSKATIGKLEALDGLILTGHFFSSWVLPEFNKVKLPQSRASFVTALENS